MLDDSNLDVLLTSAKARPAPRSAELDQALRRIARGAEDAAGATTRLRRTGRRRRYLVAGVVAGVVGLGGAATAGGLVQDWRPWQTSDGTTCRDIWQVAPADSRLAAPEGPGPRQTYDDPATLEAQAYLDAFDATSTEYRAAVEQKGAEVRASASALPAEQRPRADFVGSTEFDGQVRSMVVSDMLDAHLRAQGFDPDSVSFSSVQECDG